VLLGVKHLVIAVNKMDLVDYSEDRFLEIISEYNKHSANLGIKSLEYIPISALHGDNVVEASAAMPWFSGPPLIDYLNAVDVTEPAKAVEFRLPIQLVLRSHADFRGYAGSITSGQVRPGDRVTALPSGISSTVERIVTFNGDLKVASAGDAVTLTLGDEIDMSRGDLLVKDGENVEFDTAIEATIIWMGDTPLDSGEQLILQSHNGTANVTVNTVRYLLDVNTGQKRKAKALQLNEIADCSISADRKLLFESYESNRAGGSFILINRISNATVAAGMISGPLSPWDQAPKESLEVQVSEIRAVERQLRYRQRPCTILLTGLTGAGKSSIATALERRLFDRRNSTVRLDGENVRLGISKDLGFTAVDRSENLRRVAEIAHLMNSQGLIAIAALLAPQADARARAQELVGADKWVEVFLDTPLSVCRSRDTTGLYEAADRGDIEEFPGVSATYEEPEDADLRLDTSDMTVDQCVEAIIELLIEKGFVDG
jgi:bifunctional enzyme CysN/CysC